MGRDSKNHTPTLDIEPKKGQPSEDSWPKVQFIRKRKASLLNDVLS